MITKDSGEIHFSKDLGTLGRSERVILPGLDGCRIKLTRFYGREGSSAQDILYITDETVIVQSGVIEVWQGPDATENVRRLEAGYCYHVRAGESYSVRIVEACVLLCVFSPVVGPLPDDE